MPSSRLARTFSGAPQTGLVYTVVKTSGGTWSRSGSRILSSSPSGSTALARTGQLGALEIAADPPVLTEEELLVHLLEVEGEIERASHPRILELVAPRIEGERPHDPPIALGEFLEDDPLVVDRGEIVSRGPVLDTVLGAPVHLVGLEGFQCDRRVTKILEAN